MAAVQSPDSFHVHAGKQDDESPAIGSADGTIVTVDPIVLNVTRLLAAAMPVFPIATNWQSPMNTTV